MRMVWILPFLLVCSGGSMLSAIPADEAPIEYEISFENAAHHEARVSVTFSSITTEKLEVRMCRTSPGRYALHDFARNVYGIEAEDGQGALELAARTEQAIHALVTDVVMPRVGGYDLAHQLREMRPTLAVLFLSGYPEDGAPGANGPPEGALFLPKPFTAEALLGRLRDLLSS